LDLTRFIAIADDPSADKRVDDEGLGPMTTYLLDER
jgi:hypothetical protein